MTLQSKFLIQQIADSTAHWLQYAESQVNRKTTLKQDSH